MKHPPPLKYDSIYHNRYCRQLVYYIHHNPNYRGFCTSPPDYPWSSYLSMISVKPTRLSREKVIGWFNSESEFVEYHSQKQNMEQVKSIIIE